MMYLILLEYNLSLLPKDLEERIKILGPFMEMGKKDVESGELAMVGLSPDGRHGFAISNQDPKTIYTKTQTMVPYVRSEAKPMLSLDEAMDVLKQMQS
jgi:hypothetical protein